MAIESLRVVSLHAENVLRLRAVDIVPSGSTTLITGRNGQGKTSVIKSMWMALGGGDFAEDEPIRAGEEEARVRLDLGDIIVERTWHHDKTALKVTNRDGAAFPSPQKMLDTFYSRIALDPLEFMRMDSKAQVEVLRRVVKLTEDVDALRAEAKQIYDQRASVNADVRRYGTLASQVVVPDGTPEQAVSTDDIAAKIREVDEQNKARAAEIVRRKDRNDERLRKINVATATINSIGARDRRRQSLLDQIAKIQEEIKVLDAESDRDRDDADRIAKEAEAIGVELAALPTVPEEISASPLFDQLKAAGEVNAAVARRAQRADLQAKARQSEETSRALSEKIEAIDDRIRVALSAAKFPVDGLGFDEKQVTFNGLPLKQASSAEQLRVCVGIGLAANPKLRVVHITDGSLLDDDSLAALSAMAESTGFQLWVERVDSTGKVGVYIDDGMVAAVDGVAVVRQTPDAGFGDRGVASSGDTKS